MLFQFCLFAHLSCLFACWPVCFFELFLFNPSEAKACLLRAFLCLFGLFCLFVRLLVGFYLLCVGYVCCVLFVWSGLFVVALERCLVCLCGLFVSCVCLGCLFGFACWFLGIGACV